MLQSSRTFPLYSFEGENESADYDVCLRYLFQPQFFVLYTATFFSYLLISSYLYVSVPFNCYQFSLESSAHCLFN
jgi:hypothetical protein